MFLRKGLLPAVLLFSSIAGASDEYCSDSRWASLNPEQCMVAGAGALVTTAGGIKAGMKFYKADALEDKHTARLFTPSEVRVRDLGEIRNLSQITDGDKITINYELSEQANRVYHIELMESNASSADSRARYHTIQSMTAMKNQTIGTGKNATTIQVPDTAARLMHASMAVTASNQADDYRRQAAAARAGGPVPTYDFDKVVDDSTESRRLTEAFLDEQRSQGSKVRYINRLPKKFHNMVKKATAKAWGFTGVAAIGAAVTIEEIVAGKIAEMVRNADMEGVDLNDLFRSSPEEQ
jgi:hypothetical protein